MPFIPRKQLENRAIGQWVRLTKDIDVIAGRFTAGTVMKITGETSRGLDLVDQDGNTLIETGFQDKFLEPANDPTYDWHEKN